MIPQKVSRNLQSNPTRKGILLMVMLVSPSIFALGQGYGGGGAGGYIPNMYLLYGMCEQANDPYHCLSYESDAEAYAQKSGLCVDDNFNTGRAPFLYMYAYGSCLPTSSLWNEAHISGDFRDPGLDGYSTNTVILTGTVIGRWNGGDHCDGWFDVWMVSNSSCP
jgi:hypothetical protein